MPGKMQVVVELGETALVLPNLVAVALHANDRAKYYMSVMQACRDHASHPDHPPSDLRPEREASGESDPTFDDIVVASRSGPDGRVVIPQAARLQQRLVESVEQMLAPLQTANGESGPSVAEYERRLTALRARLPDPAADDTPAGYVESVTCAERRGPDSLHLLVMDLHRELNRLQARLAQTSVDGAAVYGLEPGDSAVIRAFMRGLNATSPLKFDHPGLDTTATRMRDRLVIQNDLGTTDAHVVVIHVTGLELSFIYTDIHPARLEFFKSMLDRSGIEWNARGTPANAAYETCIGRRLCSSSDELKELLTFIGSRLVFLIDWNRARKRLSRFVGKADAIAALRWSAEHDYGHRAFLEAGGERLIYTVLERTAAPELRYGARIDEVLGPAPALAFAQAVLRICSEALQESRSLRLVRDEVQAELLRHLHESQQGVLALAADHGALIMSLAMALRDALRQTVGDADGARLQAVAERAKRWETKADEIVARARHAQRFSTDTEAARLLLPVADDVADGLEEAIFLMTLLHDQRPGRDAIAALEPLAQLTALSAQEYVKCVETARDIRRSGTRDDMQQFLIAVDRVTTLEHESDAAERRVEAAILQAAENFRALHVLSHIAHGLEECVDALARCALALKDSMMGEMLVD